MEEARVTCAILVVSRVHFFREPFIGQRLVTPGKKDFSNYSVHN